MNSTTATYLPRGISVILRYPFLSVSPPVTSSLCSSSTKDTEAYSRGEDDNESRTVPWITPIDGILGLLE